MRMSYCRTLCYTWYRCGRISMHVSAQHLSIGEWRDFSLLHTTGAAQVVLAATCTHYRSIAPFHVPIVHLGPLAITSQAAHRTAASILHQHLTCICCNKCILDPWQPQHRPRAPCCHSAPYLPGVQRTVSATYTQVHTKSPEYYPCPTQGGYIPYPGLVLLLCVYC